MLALYTPASVGVVGVPVGGVVSIVNFIVLVEFVPPAAVTLIL